MEGYDYSTVGVYFITICVKDRIEMLWDVGTRIARPQNAAYALSSYGKAVDAAIQNIPERYPMVSVDRYVIMPNHVHLLLAIHAGEDGRVMGAQTTDTGETCGRAMRAPTVSNVINQMKGSVTKKIGFSCWQKSFHDHIIRNEEEYLMIWEYIENNPLNWENDCFYTEIKEKTI